MILLILKSIKQFSMMKKLLITLVFSGIIISSVDAQRWKLRRYEGILGVGTTNVFGDIGGTADQSNLFGLKDIEIDQTRPSFYAGIRYKLEEDMSLKLNIVYGQGSGNDIGSKNEHRELSFKTTLIESSVQYEYYFLKEDRRLKSSAVFNRRGMINNYAKLAMYAFGGVGGIYFNPSLEGPEQQLTHEWHIVDGYSNFNLTLPVGLGLKYTIDDQISLGFELGGRYTLSDYLEGFSTVFSKNNDVYYFTNLTFIYKARTDRRGRPILFR